MKDPILELVPHNDNNNINTDELLMNHDIKIQELDQRLRSLENLVNHIHNKIPVWWNIDK